MLFTGSGRNSLYLFQAWNFEIILCAILLETWAR